MTPKQRLFLLFLWIGNIALLMAICIPTGLYKLMQSAFRWNNAVTFYCVAGIIFASVEMYLYYKLKGE